MDLTPLASPRNFNVQPRVEYFFCAYFWAATSATPPLETPKLEITRPLYVPLKQYVDGRFRYTPLCDSYITGANFFARNFCVLHNTPTQSFGGAP